MPFFDVSVKLKLNIEPLLVAVIDVAKKTVNVRLESTAEAEPELAPEVRRCCTIL